MTSFKVHHGTTSYSPPLYSGSLTGAFSQMRKLRLDRLTTVNRPHLLTASAAFKGLLSGGIQVTPIRAVLHQPTALCGEIKVTLLIPGHCIYFIIALFCGFVNSIFKEKHILSKKYQDFFLKRIDKQRKIVYNTICV